MNRKLLAELTGTTKDHLIFHKDLNCHIHKKILKPLSDLAAHLKDHQFQLHIVSSFRSYEHQKKIWEEKVSGKRVLLDEFEHPIDVKKIGPVDLLFAILNWSMIPGFSRHHWGSDLDVCDTQNLAPDTEIKLTSKECAPTGPFFKFHGFLDELIDNNECYGFFRPYTVLSQGVKPERWHISHKEVADYYLNHLSLQVFVNFIEQSDLSLKEQILDHAEIIFNQYIK